MSTAKVENLKIKLLARSAPPSNQTEKRLVLFHVTYASTVYSIDTRMNDGESLQCSGRFEDDFFQSGTTDTPTFMCRQHCSAQLFATSAIPSEFKTPTST